MSDFEANNENILVGFISMHDTMYKSWLMITINIKNFTCQITKINIKTLIFTPQKGVSFLTDSQ